MTTNHPLRVLIVAGEASGDMHGAGVIKAIREIEPDAEIFGIGGNQMRAAGMEILYHINDMAILGFTEVLKHLPFIRRVMSDLVEQVRQRRPEIAILIDYPGFNLRLARKLRAEGVKILYYIAPQVWAWGAGRIAKMKKLVDQMAVVFDFEAPLFQEAGLPTEFVGHPLLEGLQPALNTEEFFAKHGLDPELPLLGLLPGSRVQEVERLLPDMLRTARLLKKERPQLQVALAMASTVERRVYDRMVLDDKLIRGIDRGTYEVMRDSRACLVASGTATLETACFATPLVVVYRVSPLSYFIGKRLVKLPYIGLVNIVAGRKIAPELVQNDFTPQKAAEAIAPLLRSGEARQRAQSALAMVREKLGTPGASERTAQLALALAGRVQEAASDISNQLWRWRNNYR
jgi:lipid-A-disaccharide synthase